MAVLLRSVITIILTVTAIMTDVVFNIVWVLFLAEIRKSLLSCCLYEHTT